MPWPPYKISSKPTNQLKSCTLLRSLIARHFETVEATALNNMGQRSFSMSSPPHKISSTSTNRFKIYKGVSLPPPQKFNKRMPFWNG
jgi:hypothetical protein